MKWMSDLLDLLYPQCCPGCGRKTTKEAPWCESCIRSFWSPRQIGSAGDAYLKGCYTLCQYQGGIRHALIGLKYSGKSDIGRTFASLLRRFPWWHRLEAYTLTVPIPLYREREKIRGYNQTDLIFQSFLEAAGKTYDPQALVRVRHTHVQSTLDREARRKNMAGVFHVNKGREFKGKSILLVDDIYTTGVTLHEAAKELRRAGAKDVMGLTLASGAG